MSNVVPIPTSFRQPRPADAIFNGTMTEGDAIKRLLIIASLLIAVIVIPTLLKKRMRKEVVSDQ